MRKTRLKSSLPLLFLLWALLCAFPSSAALKADFTASATSGCIPLSVNFTDATTGASGALTYQWRLGNGNRSSLQNPSAIYTIAGTYTVTLIVKDAAGNIDSITKTKFISVFDLPQPDFKSDVQSGCPPMTINFSDKTVKGTGAVSSWLWDFGDGNTSTQQNPGHTYTKSGKFTVTLVVTDANGCRNSIVKKDFITPNPPPDASFSASDTTSCDVPKTIQFKAATTGSGYTYLWDFGDGGTATGDSPLHDYNNLGTYTVSLTVTDASGCSGKLRKNEYIFLGKEKPNMLSTKRTGCYPLTVGFTSGTTPGRFSVTYDWDFGDGGTGTGPTPYHIYTKEGVYTVKVVAKGTNGCTDQVENTNYVTVYKPPTAAFSVSDSIVCDPTKRVSFNNNSVGGSSYKWDFGDKTLGSTDQFPTHTFKDSGFYTISLTVTDPNGCSSTLVKKNYIRISPTGAILHAKDYQDCAPVNAQFTGDKTGIVPITKWHWDFGDGSTSNEQNPGLHVYSDTGIYVVKLTVQTDNGCTAVAVDTAKAGTKPRASFYLSRRVGCLSMLRHEKFFNTTNATYKIKADKYKWLWDGDLFDQTPSPTLALEYWKPGKHYIKLVAINKACQDTSEQDSITITGPYARFSYTRSDCPDNVVYFADSSIGDTYRTYHFGDGDTSNEINPVHVYAKPGVYNPWLVVYGSNGCTDTFSVGSDPLPVHKDPGLMPADHIGLMDTIHVHPPFKDTVYTLGTKSGCAPFLMVLEAEVNDSSRIKVDWGDGTMDTLPRVKPFKQFFRHTYTKKGRFKVTFTGKSYKGCTQTHGIDSVYVSGPHAVMDVSPTSGCVPLKLQLTDNSPPDSTIMSRQWIIAGNNTIPDTAKVTTYYLLTSPVVPTDGYRITLKITSKGGCSDTVSKMIYPTGPSADFEIGVTSNCSDLTYTMNPSVQGHSPYNWKWDFGDGTTSTDVAPVKHYTKNGIFKILLSVSDGSGCTDTVSHMVDSRRKAPAAGFITDATGSQCPPLFVNITDTSIPGYFKIVKYDYDFGDGTHSEKRNPSHVYVTPGVYDVSLTITDTNGCTSTMVHKGLIVIHGPTGQMTLDSKSGCDPLTVNFSGHSTNATEFSWDLGDGTPGHGQNVTHVYKYDPNIPYYIPALILHDSFGCVYTLPRKDTIRVFPYPVADFEHSKACFGYPTYFTDITQYNDGVGSQWFWDFGDSSTSTERNPSHIYKKNGYYMVKFVAYSSKGCPDTLIRKTKIGGVGADFVTTHPTGCVSHPVYFKDRSIADTTIESWQWLFGDGDSSRQQNPEHTYNVKGIYSIKLVVNDVVGCTDTFIKAKFIVGDTVAPAQRRIYRATVLDDHNVQLDFQADTNFDFYKYIIYRQQPDGSYQVIDSILDQKDTTFQDKFLNTLQNTYTYKVNVQNACGYQSRLSSSHTTINLSAKPGINKAVLSWTPYLGWKKVKRYIIYREDVKTAGNWHLVDSVAGDTLGYTDTSIICYKPMHYKIKAVEADSGFGMVSWSDTAATLPVYIPHVPSTELVRATVNDDQYVHIEWQDMPKVKVQYWILEKSNDGQQFIEVDTPYYKSVLSADDRRTDVHKHSYIYRVKIVDSCGDMGPYSNIGKTILLHVDTTEDMRPILTWTKYRLWPEGVKQYEIQLKDNSGNFNTIDHSRNIKDTTYIDNQTDLNSLNEYCYRIIAHRNIPATDSMATDVTSMSNMACTPSHLFVWVPNVFSPNGDGVNDVFTIKGLYIKECRMRIYDRWGTKVFESNDINNGWNGRYKNGKPLMDAYKFMIYVKGVNNDEKYINGNVTVLP
jgi:gliding motility-associated-like protein